MTKPRPNIKTGSKSSQLEKRNPPLNFRSSSSPHRIYARALARLIACANLVPKIESHYWWQGKIESGAEVLLILKTTNSKLAALEKLILSQHPCDTPEFLVLPLRAAGCVSSGCWTPTWTVNRARAFQLIVKVSRQGPVATATQPMGTCLSSSAPTDSHRLEGCTGG